MNISVFGLGYVGAVTAGCLTEQGHAVIGVDVQQKKVDEVNQGHALIVEPGLPEMLKAAKERGLLRATCNCEEAIAGTDVTLVCVGTPSKHTGALDLSYVDGVVRQIGAALRKTGKSHVLILRSTMLPGSTRGLVEAHLKDLIDSGSLVVLYFPEFLRESTAVADFRDPSLVVVGTVDGGPVTGEVGGLLGAGAVAVNWETAEMVKYACNAFHATKVTFANEVGRVGKSMGIDAAAVMKLLCQDTRLNLSPYYMKPGNPFGGSCLPKDVRALSDYARQNGLNLPVLENLLVSNQQHLASLLQLIGERGHSEVVILGLSFKAETDDLRESAMVEVAQNLLGHGYQLRIFDPQLNLARMVGSNKRVIDIRMPHLASLLHDDLASALGKGGLVLAAQKCVGVEELSAHVTSDHHIVDINGWPELKNLSSNYEGFCW